MKKLVSQKQTRCVSSVEAIKRKEIKMRSAGKKVIFTFSLFGSIAAQAISVGKVDFEKKSITGVEVELASSKSNNVSVCGAHVGGLWSLTRNNVAGIQVGGFVSCCSKEMNGVQIGGLFCFAEKMRGVQISFTSDASVFSGLQIGAINYFIKDVSGVQIGVFNYAGEKSDNCLQIGVVNWLSANETMKIVPFVNFRF